MIGNSQGKTEISLDMAEWICPHARHYSVLSEPHDVRICFRGTSVPSPYLPPLSPLSRRILSVHRLASCMRTSLICKRWDLLPDLYFRKALKTTVRQV